MSVLSRPTHKMLAIAGLAAACFGASATAAQAAPKSLAYSCVYPYVGAQPLTIQLDVTPPEPVQGRATAALATQAILNTAGLSEFFGATQAATFYGSVNVEGTVSGAGLDASPAYAALKIADQAVPADGASVTAAGQFPGVTFPGKGAARLNADRLSLVLAMKDAAGNPLQIPRPPDDETDYNPFVANITCALAPATQDTTLAALDVVADEPEAAEYASELAGSATLKTLVKGSAPLAGGLTLSYPPSGGVIGTLNLDETSANLTALGFLPVVAKLAFVPTAPLTGTLEQGVLAINAKVRIKLPSVTLFGVELASGGTCQVKSPSNIALKSTEASVTPASPATLAGTFAISDLTGCGSLNGIISPLTAGNGNAIVLRSTPILN